jgi:hypothetical protein
METATAFVVSIGSALGEHLQDITSPYITSHQITAHASLNQDHEPNQQEPTRGS